MTAVPTRELRLRLALVASVLLGFALRAWGLTWGLYNANVSRRPHPDEWPVYWLFRWFGTNHNLDPCPHSGSACFFDWGMAYPYLAYGMRFLIRPISALVPARDFGPHADMNFVWSVLAGRSTSLVLSTATILVVYQLGAIAFDQEVGVVAAMVTSLSALFVQLAHFATPDSLTTFLVSCTLLAAFKASRHERMWWFVLTGALVGVSTGSEYHMALLSVPLLAAWWMGGSSRHVRYLIAALGFAVITYLASSAYALLHMMDFLAAMEHTLRIRTVDSGLQYGDRWAVFGPAWLYVVRYPLGYGVGFALTSLMLAGTAWSLVRRTSSDWLLLSWLCVYFLLVTLSPAKFMRYSAPLLPVLAVMAGRLAIDLGRMRPFWARNAARTAVVGGMLIALIYDGAYISLFTATDPRLGAASWLSQHNPPSADVAFDQLPNGLINVPYFFTSLGYHPCFSQFHSAALANQARYVVTDNYDLEEHPRVEQATVDTFHRVLENDPDYRVVLQVHHVPTFLGMTFSIDGSPHDWRYPSHVITVYEKRPTAPQLVSPTCYPTLASARTALYPASSGS